MDGKDISGFIVPGTLTPPVRKDQKERPEQ
jgi:hypothetical protein